MFCFLIAEPVMLPLKTLSFKRRAVYIHTRAELIRNKHNEQTKGKFP